MPSSHWRTLGVGVLLLVGSVTSRARAQAYANVDLGGFLQVGGEGERYARVLQIAGIVPLTPWSIQPFSPSQDALLRPNSAQAHPWKNRFAASNDSAAIQILRPSARLIANSAFPYQVGGGPTWAGRGLTGEAQGGIAARWRHVYAQLAPLGFVAQNAAFALASNDQAGDGRFADARFPTVIDAPQRFGNGAYARLTPGTSSLSVDAYRVVLGLSTAPQRWGPSREYPLVLGPNAGGFPMVYAGTSSPANLWLFRVHARLIYGELGQSAFAPPDSGIRRRFAAGVVGVITPRGVPGLEIGGSRFLHRPWHLSAHAFGRPFAGIINNGNPNINGENENQVASVFVRWALPQAKAEFYGEMYREDFPGPFHAGTGTLVENPEDYSSYALGFQRAFVRDSQHIRVLRGELVNGESSHQQRLERGFDFPLPPYIHTGLTQGHTLHGLLLGSPEAYGGAGWRIGVDDFSPSGRRSIGIERSLRFDWLPSLAPAHPQVEPDVIYAVRAEAVRFRGARDYGLTIIPALDLNRNLVAKHDAFNLTIALSAHGW